MRRPVFLQLVEASCKLARRALVVAIEEVIEADGNLDKPLKKQPVDTASFMPEIFERIVAFKEAAAIKLLYAALKLAFAHRLEYTKKFRYIQAFKY